MHKKILYSVKLYFVFMIYFIMFSCDNTNKYYFVGEWIEASREIKSLIIEKNNNNFIVNYEGNRLPGIYNSGYLEVTIGGLNPRMMLDEKTKRLLFLENEYIRIEKSILSKLIGTWKLDQDESDDISRNRYIRLEKATNGSIIFSEGFWYENDIYFGNENNRIYLNFYNGMLSGKLNSHNFRATKGYVVDYEILVEPLSNNRIKYKVGSNLVNEEFFGEKVN